MVAGVWSGNLVAQTLFPGCPDHAHGFEGLFSPKGLVFRSRRSITDRSVSRVSLGASSYSGPKFRSNNAQVGGQGLPNAPAQGIVHAHPPLRNGSEPLNVAFLT